MGKTELSSSQLTATQVIVVNPELAGYLKDEGFVSDMGNTGFVSTLPEVEARIECEGYSYRKESYEDHIERVLTGVSGYFLERS